jgi:hypothetical protein
LIERYSKAECIPLDPKREARAWSHTLVTNSGENVEIFGAQEIGGRINVRFEPNGEEKVAVNAGDYIYPADVRFDRAMNRIYVRAGGVRPVPFGGNQVWLFEYDLERRRRTERKRVEPSVLVDLCKKN